MKLSIIVCVYNTAPYLVRECLDSIVRSTLADYEICFIDDGSSVDYGDLIAEYPVRYVRAENHGILDARFVGVDAAQGDYVTFVDSDDEVSFDYHRPMLEKAAATGADIVTNDWAFWSDRTRYVCRTDPLIASTVERREDDVLLAYASQDGRAHSFFVLWNKIYKRELIVRAVREIRGADIDVEHIGFGDDATLNFFCYRDAKLLTGVHTGYYFYRTHSGQSVNIVSEESLTRQIVSMTNALSAMRENVGENVHREAILSHLAKWNALMSRSHYSHAKTRKYKSLYPMIRERYGVSKLKKATVHDSSVYIRHRILPSNYAEIEDSLLMLYHAGDATVAGDVSNPIVRDTIERYRREGRTVTVTAEQEAQIVFPKAIVPFRDRLLHQYFVYRVGVLLFPKGGRIRTFLKRHI